MNRHVLFLALLSPALLAMDLSTSVQALPAGAQTEWIVAGPEELVLYLAFDPATVHAVPCDCIVVPTSEANRSAAVRRELVESDAVFVGTMTDLVDAGDSIGMRVLVGPVWKGKPGKEVVLAFGLRGGGSSCWYTPQSGQHLFFAKRDSSGWWVAYSCGSTGAVDQRTEVSRFLKELCQSAELCSKQAPSTQANRQPHSACSRRRRVQG